jgi:hypothetical protein
VPRFSASSVEGLKKELLSVDYKSLLSEDVMGSEVGGMLWFLSLCLLFGRGFCLL